MEKHKVLAVYMISFKPIPQSVANMAAASLSLLMFQQSLSDWDGRIHYADITDSSKFKSLDDAILPYIISIDGGKHLTGQPDNTAIIIEDKKTIPGQLLYTCILAQGPVGSFPSTQTLFPSVYGIDTEKDSNVAAVLQESQTLESQGKYRDALELCNSAFQKTNHISLGRKMAQLCLQIEPMKKSSIDVYMKCVQAQITHYTQLTAEDYTLMVRGIYEWWKDGNVSKFDYLVKETNMSLEDTVLKMIANARATGGKDPALDEIEKQVAKKTKKKNPFFGHRA